MTADAQPGPAAAPRRLAPDYPILTVRLSLRPPTVADAAAATVYKSRPDVVRFVPYGPLTEAEVAERFSTAPTTIDDEHQFLGLLAHRRDTGELVGDVVLMYHSHEHLAGELGYILDPVHEGHGYATEASRALLRLGFDGLGLHRMSGRLDARNTASARVLERIGMRREAHFRSNEWFKGEWTDELVYAMLADEWHAAQHGADTSTPDGGR